MFKRIHRNNRYMIIGLSVLLAALAGVVIYVRSRYNLAAIIQNALTVVDTQPPPVLIAVVITVVIAVGITMVITFLSTFFVLEALNRRRTALQEKDALIFQLGSPDNSFALEAARILQVRGWMLDGSLKGLFLAKANLEGGGLWKANLQGAEMIQANLSRANLHRAKLQDAKMWEVNLQQAELLKANLSRADLRQANLEGAQLWEAVMHGTLMEHANLHNANLRHADLQDSLLLRANLRGAQFLGANLQGVRFLNAEFDEAMVLPDGTTWTDDTDLSRFTDPQHADFWRPEPDAEGHLPPWYKQDGFNLPGNITLKS